MNHVRTFFGLLIMIFLAVPVLFGIIWAVGFTQGVVSPKTLSELPREVIAEIPEVMDGMMAAARDENSDLDYETRAWWSAIAAAGTSPRQVMEETGMRDWMEKELTRSLAELGQILNGKSAQRSVWLDLQPLKAALNHPAAETWLTQVLEKLPACSPGESESWSRVLEDGGDLPPCRPADLPAAELVARTRERLDREIPERVNLLEDAHFPRRNFNIALTVNSFAYLLFLIPAAFIALGAAVGGRGWPGFLRWSGAATLVGGGLVLALSSLAKQTIPWGMRFGPAYRDPNAWVTWNDMSQHASGILQALSRHFMSPVTTVAGAVCVVGLLLFAFSFTINRPANS